MDAAFVFEVGDDGLMSYLALIPETEDAVALARRRERDQNVELARGGLQSWVEGDRDGAMETLSEDVEIYVPLELGNAGTYRGRENFLRWVEQWDEAWSDFEMSVDAIEPVGERHVVALVRSRGRGRGSGIDVENSLGWVIGVKGDLCNYISLQPSLDDARAHAEGREGTSGLA
jgi:ketosteroid isomerase-like protein